MAKKSTRLLSFILAMLMLISMLSSMAFAQYAYNEEQTTKNYVSIAYNELVGPRYEKEPGVYIINSEWAYEEGEGPASGTVTFEFRNETVTETYNPERHFESVTKAQKFVTSAGINNPIFILTAGIHSFNYATRYSATFLGPKAGMNPNVPDADPTKEWKLSEDRYLPAETATETNGEAVLRPNATLKMITIDNDGNKDVKLVIDGVVFQGNGAGVGDETYRNGGSVHKVYVQNCILDNTYASEGRGGGATFGFDMRNSQEHEKHLYLTNLYIINQNKAALYSGHASVVEMNGCSYQRSTNQPFNTMNAIPWQGQRTKVTNCHFWNPEGVSVISGGDTGYFFAGNWNSWSSNTKPGNDEVEFSATFKNNTFYNVGSSSRPMVRVGMAGNSIYTMEDNIFIDTENHASHDVFVVNYIASAYNGSITRAHIGGGQTYMGVANSTGLLVTEGKYFMDSSRVSIKNNTFIGSEYQNIPNIGNNTHPETDVQMSGNLYLDSLDSTEGKIIEPKTADSKIYNQWVWLDADMTQKSSEIFEDDVTITSGGAALDGSGYMLSKNLTAKEYTMPLEVSTNAENGVRVYKSDAEWIKGSALTGTENADHIAYTLDSSARTSYYIVSVTSVDGRTERDYKITVNRAANPDAQLLDIIPEAGVDADVEKQGELFIVKANYYQKDVSFKLSVSAGAKAIVRQGFNVIFPDSNGVYTFKDLAINGSQECTIAVTGSDGLQETFNAKFTRMPNDEAELLSVDTSDADSITAAGEKTFIVSLPASVKNTTLALEISEGATAAMIDPVYQAQIENKNNTFVLKNIASGKSTYKVNILAQDGIVAEEWYIIIDRAMLTGCELLSVGDAEKIGNMYVVFTPNENFTVSAQVSEGAKYYLYTDATCTEALASPHLTLTEATTVIWIVVVAEDGVHASDPVKMIINTYDDPDNNTEHPATLPMEDDGIIAVSGGHFDPDSNVVIIPLDPETKQINLTVQGYADHTVRLYSDQGPKPMKVNNKSTLTLDAGRTILYATATIDADPNAEVYEYAIFIVSPRYYKYTDKQTSWASAYVKDVAENGWGLLKGDAAAKFNGKNPITRYEVAALMVRVIGANAYLYENAKNPFADVAEDHWATDYVKAAYRIGMINGIEEGGILSFNGANNATRVEFFKIFLDALILDLNGYYETYQKSIDAMVAAKKLKDLDQVADWAKPATYVMISFGLVVGDQNQNVNPTNTITRDEVAVILGKGYDFLVTDPEYWFSLI